MHQMPGQLAWQLQKGNPDHELVRTIVALLRSQINLIQGVTQWVKPSIIQREHERIRLLVWIKGKATNKLLRNLAVWVRGRCTKVTGQDTLQKKQQLEKKVHEIKAMANNHLLWLTEIENLEHELAVKELREEYYSL